MFAFLGKISPSLYQRYETLDTNLRSASCSFYDAYLDLLEAFLRTVAAAKGVEAPPRATAGELLRREEVVGMLLGVGIPQEDVGKLSDYVLKINRHKHGNEKEMEIDIAVRYLSLLHRVSAAYAASLGVIAPVFVEEYYRALFGSYERENRVLREDISERVEALDGKVGEIAAYVRRMENAETAKQERERVAQEAVARREEEQRRSADTLRFLKSAKRTYHYLLGAGEFEKNRVITVLASLVTVGLLFGFYFSFGALHSARYQDWGSCYWFLFIPVLVFVFHQLSVTVRALFAGDEASEAWICRHTSPGRGPIGEAIPTGVLPVGYTLWPIFGLLFSLFFGVFAWVDYDAAWMLFVFVPLISAGMFVSRHFFDELCGGFMLISYEGRSPSTGKTVRLYYEVLLGKYIDEGECRRCHPWLFS